MIGIDAIAEGMAPADGSGRNGSGWRVATATARLRVRLDETAGREA